MRWHRGRSKDSKAGSLQPEDNRFNQQSIPGQRPLLTPIWLILIGFGVTCIFIPIGAVSLKAALSVVEVIKEYDSACISANTDAERNAAMLQTDGAGTACTLQVTVPSYMKAPVYFYYGLQGFHQNHRRYVQSRSDRQMRGAPSSGSTGYCDPEQFLNGDKNLPILPCGLAAWSTFNDTFQVSIDGAAVDVDESGISWSQDRDHKYASILPSDYQTIPALRGGAGMNTTLNRDEHFIVWMRPATMPNFRKLWGRISRNIPQGTLLTVTIDNRYNTYQFGGRKYVILSTASWLGGRNDFLGIAFLTVGGSCLIFSLALAVLQTFYRRKLGDLTSLSWHKTGDLPFPASTIKSGNPRA